MPVGAGGEALERIEAALAAEDPALDGAFRNWHECVGPDLVRQVGRYRIRG